MLILRGCLHLGCWGHAGADDDTRKQMFSHFLGSFVTLCTRCTLLVHWVHGEKNEEQKGLFGYGSVMIHDSSGFRGLQAVK